MNSSVLLCQRSPINIQSTR